MNEYSRSFDPNQYLGTSIIVRTTFGDVYKGEVFCYDNGPINCLILKEMNEDNTANFRIFKSSIIREIEAQSLPPTVINNDLPFCEKSILAKIEHKSLAEFELKKHTIGIGVTSEAQDLYDFISKTHPKCIWRSQEIIVLGVTISPPYKAENCYCEDSKLKARIQLVVTKFHEKYDKDRRTRRGINSQLSIDNSVGNNLNNVTMNNTNDNNAHTSNSSSGCNSSVLCPGNTNEANSQNISTMHGDNNHNFSTSVHTGCYCPNTGNICNGNNLNSMPVGCIIDNLNNNASSQTSNLAKNMINHNNISGNDNLDNCFSPDSTHDSLSINSSMNSNSNTITSNAAYTNTNSNENLNKCSSRSRSTADNGNNIKTTIGHSRGHMKTISINPCSPGDNMCSTNFLDNDDD